MRVADYFSRLFGRDKRGDNSDVLAKPDTSSPRLGPTPIPIGKCNERKECLVAGTLVDISASPPGAPVSVVGVLQDDSGDSIALVWLGRHRVPGIEVGASLRAKGTIQTRKGRLAMVDPLFTVVAGGPR